MNVTLSEVKRAARAHRAPLAGESAGYLVLALADQVLSAPRVLAPSDVLLSEDGALRVLAGEASSDTEAEIGLRRALDELLLVASSGSAALMRAGRRSAPVGLASFVKELEAALIPVNRSAAKRALARLQRETARAVASGDLPIDAAAPEAETPSVGMLTADLPINSTHSELETASPADFESLPRVASWVPPAVSSLAGAVTPLADEPTRELSPSMEVRTIAIQVDSSRTARESAPQPLAEAEICLSEEDLEILEEDGSDDVTIALVLSSLPSLRETEEPALVDLPTEACTRPEPVILRRSLRALAELVLPGAQSLAHTPTLGSLVRELPTLSRERIAELSSLDVATPGALSIEPAADSECPEVYTEPMPDVEPLRHGVSLLPARRSELSELLASFQVGPDESHQGLRREVKALAELDLTPAPFGALNRSR